MKLPYWLLSRLNGDHAAAKSYMKLNKLAQEEVLRRHRNRLAELKAKYPGPLTPEQLASMSPDEIREAVSIGRATVNDYRRAMGWSEWLGVA